MKTRPPMMAISTANQMTITHPDRESNKAAPGKKINTAVGKSKLRSARRNGCQRRNNPKWTSSVDRTSALWTSNASAAYNDKSIRMATHFWPWSTHVEKRTAKEVWLVLMRGRNGYIGTDDRANISLPVRDISISLSGPHESLHRHPFASHAAGSLAHSSRPGSCSRSLGWRRLYCLARANGDY